MVKIRGALYSNEARGWLGRDHYLRTGANPNPYPIGLHFSNRYHSIYYSSMGWCYQVRRTWHGLQQIAMRPPTHADANTVPQQAQRAKFLNGVAAWNALPQAEKDDYNERAVGKAKTGYQLFMSDYLKGKV